LNDGGWFGSPEIAAIRLRGYPYEQVIDGEPHDSTDTLNGFARNESYENNLALKLAEHEPDLEPLRELGFHGLDAKVKSPGALTYEEAFSLATFVCLTSNRELHKAFEPELAGIGEPETLRLQAVSLLQGMSTRESLIGFEPQEIAGMVAATLELDTVARVASPSETPTFIVGGMGGDRGIPSHGEQSKLFSTSTLASIALAGLVAVHKHHSYPNTSKAAGQSAIEALGARSDMEDAATMELALGISGMLMTSCHSVRTLHTISHILKGETVNHAIGPLAVPHASSDKVNALVGVNHNVHPTTIIETLRVLQTKGIQDYGNSVAFCGVTAPVEELPAEILDPKAYYAAPDLKELIMLDEVAPPPFVTMASFLVDGQSSGPYLIEPIDFMEAEEAEAMSSDGLLIPNTLEDIMTANNAVIQAQDHMKTKYVAMTVALANFARDYAHLPDALDVDARTVNRAYLRACFRAAVENMSDGSMENTTRLYGEATQKDMLPNIDVVVLDIDNTLIRPKNQDFYEQYSEAVNLAIANYLGVNLEEATKVADFFRENFGGGEQALFSGAVGDYFPQYGNPSPDFELLYDAMSQIKIDGQFGDDGLSAKLVKLLRAKGKKVVAMTDSPESLSRQTLKACGFDPDSDFDLYVPYTKESGPPKIVQADEAFKSIADYFEVDPNRVLSVGDSLTRDIVPAERSGMKTCLVSQYDVPGYEGLQVTNLADTFRTYRRSL